MSGSASAPVGRFSERQVAVSAARSDRVLVVEGHGEWVSSTVPQRFQVPSGAEIVVYQGMDVAMDDRHGVRIGQQQGLQSRLPTEYDPTTGEYATDPNGEVRTNTPRVRVYRSGELCPNLTLYAYDEPGFQTITPPQQGSYAAMTGRPERLKDIVGQHLKFHNGSCQFRWGACTVLYTP